MPAAKSRGIPCDDLAKALDVPPATVRGWIKEGGCPHNKIDGRITMDLRSVRAWLEARGGVRAGPGRPATGPGSGGSVSTKEAIALATLRKLIAHAERAETENERRRGELVSRAEVETGRVQRCVLFRSALMALPSRVTPMLIGRDAREIEAALDVEMRRVLGEFAAGPEGPEQSGDGA